MVKLFACKKVCVNLCQYLFNFSLFFYSKTISSAPKFFDFSTNPANRKLYTVIPYGYYSYRKMPEAKARKRKMKQQKRNFRSDTKAVSEVIGMVLLLAILVTFFTLIQVSVVPDWNKQVEADHIPAVYDDMTSLSSDISDSASRAIAKSSSIQLGARYPDRMIFLNPGPGAFGTLTVENDVAVSVVCKDSAEVVIASRDFNTSRLIYDLTGTVNSPKLVYEHGIIIREWDDGTVLGPVPPENHTLFDDCSANVYIPIVNGSSTSASSLDSKLVSIFPFSESETIDDIVSLNITLDTDYPDVWRKLFKGSTNTNVTATVSVDDKIKINSTEGVIDKIYLPVIDDVISSDLYVGVITATATLGGGLWVAGEGTDIMAMGSRVANIPSSATATAIVVQDFVVDKSIAAKLDNDFIAITVTDYSGNWWKAEMLFQKPNEIKAIYLKSGNGASENLTDFSFIDYPTVDLFDPANFETTDGIGGMYQDASVGSDNRLVTLVGDTNNMINNALISFRLLVDGD